MDRFCFSSVASILKLGLQPPNDNIDVCRYMLEWIVHLPNVKNREGKDIVVDDNLTHRLMSKLANVQASIREEASDEKKIMPLALENAKNIIARLNFVTKDDMYEKLVELIEDDSNISKTKKQAFHSWFGRTDKTEFIAHVILYAIAVQNKFSDITSEDEIHLLSECDNHCPVCGELLVSCSEGGIPLSLYEIVRIYPKKESCAKKLSGIPKPDNLDSLDNTILLCPRHAQEYTKTLSVDTYYKMRTLKDDLVQKNSEWAQLQNIRLEKELQDLISALGSISDEEKLEELSYEALRIREKIPNDFLLRNDVEKNVLRYFNFITGCFSRMDQEKSGFSNRIAGQIKFAYLTLKSTTSQSQLVDKLSCFIEEKIGRKDLSKITYRILVHYFIQHCEVFDAFSK